MQRIYEVARALYVIKLVYNHTVTTVRDAISEYNIMDKKSQGSSCNTSILAVASSFGTRSRMTL